jgi:hypothetical protein
MVVVPVGLSVMAVIVWVGLALFAGFVAHLRLLAGGAVPFADTLESVRAVVPVTVLLPMLKQELLQQE